MGFPRLRLELIGQQGRLDRCQGFVERVDDAEHSGLPTTRPLPPTDVLAAVDPEFASDLDAVANNGAIVFGRRAWQAEGGGERVSWRSLCHKKAC